MYRDNNHTSAEPAEPPPGYSRDDSYVPIVVTLSPNVIEALEVLGDNCTAETALERIAFVVSKGVTQPDSPERAWVVARLGSFWLKDMEPNPDLPYRAERPKRSQEWRSETQPPAGTTEKPA